MEINTQTLKQILIVGILLLIIVILDSPRGMDSGKLSNNVNEQIASEGGIILPIQWRDFGKRMVEEGIIDGPLFESIYENRGGIDSKDLALLYGESNQNIKLTRENSSFILNLLWAFGLSNKNLILEEGEMTNPKYGGAERFASTGGWNISKENSMNYYSKYDFVVLTRDQQELVERVSKNIYRPCCNNSTHFPDCNHGMAMLGLLELLAKEGLSEEEIYDISLNVNSYWFPDTYLNIAKYFSERGVSWDEVSPKEVLSSAYSSASGYKRVLGSIKPAQGQSGTGCGV